MKHEIGRKAMYHSVNAATVAVQGGLKECDVIVVDPPRKGLDDEVITYSFVSHILSLSSIPCPSSCSIINPLVHSINPFPYFLILSSLMPPLHHITPSLSLGNRCTDTVASFFRSTTSTTDLCILRIQRYIHVILTLLSLLLPLLSSPLLYNPIISIQGFPHSLLCIFHINDLLYVCLFFV